MLGYATSLQRTGKLDECDQLASRLLEESTAAVDKLGIAGGHRLLGAVAMLRGNLDVAHDHLDASVAILNQPVKGNGLVSLAHQLIAAKLNGANGATCKTVAKLIKDADAAMYLAEGLAGGVLPEDAGRTPDQSGLSEKGSWKQH